MLSDRELEKVSANDVRMLRYLNGLFDDWLEDKEKFGMDDRIVRSRMTALLGCKDMVEALIGMPVNLQLDGNLTVGF